MTIKTTLLTLICALAPSCLHAAAPPAPYGPVPTESQVKWLRMEWYAFVHFGLNTYTEREWGYGDESPALFNPKHFDADAIARTFREAGMAGMIYTAKHHDGWCAWQTKTTAHNITASPWKEGKGDVVRAFAEACRRNGIAFGTYLSPWDRNHAEYGRAGYLADYYAQVEELLTRYGDIFEIWFDGANGGDGYYGGAREKRNIGKARDYYDFPKLVAKIRALQPDCIIWGAGGLGDVEWGGSEKGHVPYPLSNVQEVDGRPRWVSLEGDTPINGRGWFWHPGQQTAVKPPAQLMQVYLDSVGRGANLILNVAPNRDGQLDAADVASLLKFGELRRKLLAQDFAEGAAAVASEVRGNDPQFAAAMLTDGDIETYWCPEDGTTMASATVTLAAPCRFDCVRLREQIRLGQRVKAFEIDARIDGAWQTIDAGGGSIGNQVIRKLAEPVTADAVRLRITAAGACPCISELSLLRMPELGGEEQQKADTGLPKDTWKGAGKPAFDNDPATLWTAGGAQPCLEVDMGRPQPVSSFSYLPRQDGSVEGIADRYKLELSLDGKEWALAAEGEFSNMLANPIEQRVRFSTTRARHWRFTPLRTLDGKPATVAEINMYP